MSDDLLLLPTLDLLRRLPPQSIQSNLDALVSILPEEVGDELLGSVDVPLGVRREGPGEGGREYLICDYNRDGDSYRSPWTSHYSPPLPDGGTQPSPKLRKLESAMNDAFEVYRDMYYEGGVASVYLWDVEDGFAGVVLLKKATESNGSTASWDSVHVFESTDRGGRTASYKLTSTVMLYLTTTNLSAEERESAAKSSSGEVKLGGSMTRQNELEAPLDSSSTAANMSSHIANLGRMIEDMESKMRGSLSEVYFSKTKDITTTLRSSLGYAEGQKRNLLQGELVGLLKGRKMTAA